MNPLSYEQFGHEFVHRLITPERVRRELQMLLAEPIEGVMNILPADMITARYVFKLSEVKIALKPERLPELALRQRLLGTLELSVRILGMPFGFTLRVGIRLDQQVRAYAPLTLKLETKPCDAASLDIDVDAHGLPSEILDRFNIIENAVRAEVVQQVNQRLESGPVARALNIDVARLAEHAVLIEARKPLPATAAPEIPVTMTPVLAG